MDNRTQQPIERLEIDSKEKYAVLIQMIQNYNCMQSIVAVKNFIQAMRAQKSSIFTFRGQQMGFHVFPFILDLILKHSTSMITSRILEDNAIAWLIDKYVDFPEILTLQEGTNNLNKYAPEWYLRAAFEQLTYQEMTRTLIPRILLLYDNIPNSSADKYSKFIQVRDEVLRKQFRVTLDDLLLCTFVLGAIARTSDRFQEKLVSEIEWLKPYIESDAMPIVRSHLTLTRDQYQTRAIELFSGNYTHIRTEPMLLFEYPIIKFDEYYICPDYRLLLARVTKLLHSWFYQYFIDNKIEEDYPAIFGEVFKEYVGLLLKNCCGEKNVFDADLLKTISGRKVDWIIIVGEVAAIVECKFLRFPKKLKQTGDIEILESFMNDRVAIAFGQIDQTVSQWQKISCEILPAKSAKSIYRIILIEDHLEFANSLIDFLPDNNVLKKIVETKTQILSILELETLVTSSYANDFLSVLGEKVNGENCFLSFDQHLRKLPNYSHNSKNVLDEKFNEFFRRKS